MTDAQELESLVEFKLWLVRSVEDHVLRELLSAAKAQGRRLPVVTRALVRTGASSAVSELSPAELARFADGDSWREALRVAVANGAWGLLVEETIRCAFAPETA